MDELVHRARSWSHAHPTAADTVLAAVLAASGVPFLYLASLYPPHARGGDALGLGLVLWSCLPLSLRRRWPLLVTLTVAAPSAALGVLHYSTGTAGIAIIIAAYTAAAYGSLVRGIAGAAVYEGIGIGILALDGRPQPSVSYLLWALAVLGLWAFGRWVGQRRAYTTWLESRADQLERAREADVRAVRAEERSRIAREVHDVVAHHVSVMTVQATAARRVLERNPARAAEALAQVENTGRAALAEIRRTVGVLRTDDATLAAANRTPQPGLEELCTLVGQVREAGLTVELVAEGTPRPLSPGIDLAAYRVVQEALTNVLKHAGPGTSARVVLEFGTESLAIHVTDDGRHTVDGAARGETRIGHGLVGMHERIALYGGNISTGPRPGGGYGVCARIPLEDATA